MSIKNDLTYCTLIKLVLFYLYYRHFLRATWIYWLTKNSLKNNRYNVTEECKSMLKKDLIFGRTYDNMRRNKNDLDFCTKRYLSKPIRIRMNYISFPHFNIEGGPYG